jgi:hypothetical protein
MTRDEHYVKYLDCAKRVLPPEDIERVHDMVETLERLADIRQLIAPLARNAGEGGACHQPGEGQPPKTPWVST